MARRTMVLASTNRAKHSPDRRCRARVLPGECFAPTGAAAAGRVVPLPVGEGWGEGVRPRRPGTAAHPHPPSGRPLPRGEAQRAWSLEAALDACVALGFGGGLAGGA